MIPLVIGAAAIAGGVATAAALSSSDDDKKNSETTSTRAVSDNYVEQKMARMGRPIKTAGVKITDSTKKIIKSQTVVSPVERVKQIIAEQLDLNENQIQMSSRIVEDLGANYNDKCIILDLVGEEFGVNFFGKEIRTVGNIFNYIG
jgi:acyl carrier protein